MSTVDVHTATSQQEYSASFLCGLQVLCVGFLWALWFPPIVQTQPDNFKWPADAKASVNGCLCPSLSPNVSWDQLKLPHDVLQDKW